MRKSKIKVMYSALSLIFIIGSTSYFNVVVQAQDSSGNSTLETINEDIKSIKDRIKDLEAQKEQFQQDISQLQSDRLSLVREIDIINNRIAQKEIEIYTQIAKIDQTELEIQGVQEEIRKAEKNIEGKKTQLGFVLDKLNREDVVDYFEIFLRNDNFADFFDAVKGLEDIQSDVLQLVNDVKEHKRNLEKQQDNLEERKEFQNELKMVLEEKKVGLIDQQNAKHHLVSVTRYDERKFQGLIAEIKREQQSANADIISLEKEIRSQLDREQALSSLGGDEEFAWPVSSQLITARFHDPTYPYRYVFEHPAIDIAISQGSPIRATKSGYVGRAKDSGLGYSYILLIHDEGISSVYGHVSQININEDEYVVQGQVIGLSGGVPGTPGAGSFSTGAHLHFELRKDGIPVNPENYLL